MVHFGSKLQSMVIIRIGVLIKSDGSPTYFIADIAYHDDKFQRGFKGSLTYGAPTITATLHA